MRNGSVNYCEDNSFAIGNTPLVRLRKVVDGRSMVFAKVESRNPSFSVKCRIGASMVWDAEERGVLRPGMEIIEPTSGNTGIALAYVGAARGYGVTLTMPESMSVERRKILKAFRASLVLTDAARGMRGAVEKAEELAAQDSLRYFMPQQFRNPANPAIHERTTGAEIWRATDGKIDVLVSGVGTGGTITGVSRYIKNTAGKRIVSVAVEPANSPVISQTLAGETIRARPHLIQGIGAGFVPEVLDLSLIDRVELVSSQESMKFAQRLTAEEGILSGVSAGAATAVAARLAAMPEFQDRVIVVILPDSGERYLSTILFADE